MIQYKILLYYSDKKNVISCPLSSFHPLWENEKSMMIYNSIIQIQFFQISISRRYSSSQYLLHVTKKSLSVNVLRGWTFCVILQKHWISCKTWLMSLKSRYRRVSYLYNYDRIWLQWEKLFMVLFKCYKNVSKTALEMQKLP